MKAIIVDDDLGSILVLTDLLKKHCRQVELIGIAGDAMEGTKLIMELNPDIVFIDIGPTCQSGFDMPASLGHYRFNVIFITVQDHYSIHAIKCSALDYLVKPLQAAGLRRAIKQAEENQHKQQMHEQISNLLSMVRSPNITGHRIVLPLMKELRLVNPHEIIRCEGANKDIYFYLLNEEKLIVSKGISEFEELLKPYNIIRCHKSYLVNLQCVKSLYRRKDYVNELALTDGSVVPVSRFTLKELKYKMNNVKNE